MCGFAGVLGPRPLSPQRQQAALEVLRHRGPDGSGLWQGDIGGHSLSLLHRRLAIIDLDPRSDQPMERDGRILAFNGEIYNYLEVRNELSKLGHRFKTDSDTEVVIEAYRRWGTDCVDRFEGMWALALADTHRNLLWLSRDRFGEAWRERQAELQDDTQIKIVGSLGRLSGTANTHGIHYLTTRVAPLLPRPLGDRPYERNLYGGTNLASFVEQTLTDPRIRLRGFVPDIDRELLSSHLFLCLNNATAYKVGHTRYLHAWSLGCCVVAHRDANLSMPEIRHEENALLGGSPEEIADLIAIAAKDSELRRRIGEGGYETFQSQFRTEKVARKIFSMIEKRTG